MFYGKEGCYSGGDRVVMTSFNGTTQPTGTVKLSENYWLLVGVSGVIAKTWEQAGFAMDEKKFLVTFDQNVKDVGLHCHNEIENSLWILASDIVSISVQRGR